MKANIAATKEHCKHCFDALIAKLYNKALPPYPNTLNDDKVPIFVTWKIKEDLRGCIGLSSLLIFFIGIDVAEGIIFEGILRGEFL